MTHAQAKTVAAIILFFIPILLLRFALNTLSQRLRAITGKSLQVLVIGILDGNVELLAYAIDHQIGYVVNAIRKAAELHR
jgi:hypothetical protein